MLFNPDWNENKIDEKVFTNESLIAWLEKQPANAWYPYADAANCMLAQYFDAHGFEYAYVSSSGVVSDLLRPSNDSYNGHYTVRYNPMWNSIAQRSDNFGDALRILRSL